jgi:hypothetical protein
VSPHFVEHPAGFDRPVQSALNYTNNCNNLPADLKSLVMPGLVPGIHVFLVAAKDVDGRVKPGHDE